MQEPNERRVRPVPIHDDLAAPLATRIDRERTQNLSVAGPLALMALTLALVVVAVLGFGAIEDPAATIDIAEPLDFSSTPRDGSPGGQLLIAAASEGAGWAVVWDSSPDPFSIGSIGAIPAPSEVSTNPPALDADGSFLATNQCIGDRCGVRIARADDPTRSLSFVEAGSYAWHSQEPLRLAWVEAPGDVVQTGYVDSLTGQLVERNATPAPRDDLRLVRWDSDGFVLTADVTMALDNEGRTLWTQDGRLLDVDSSFATVGRDQDWAIVDRLGGSDVVVASPSEGLLTVANSAVGTVRSETTGSGYTYTLDLLQPASARPQTSAPNLRQLPIGTEEGAEYRIYRGGDNGSITIVFERPEPPAAAAGG